MKQISTFIAIIIITLACTSCTSEEKNKEPIKILLDVWPGYAHAYIAKEKGFFAQHGVNVELILTKTYGESSELYKNGKVDGILEVYSDSILQNAQGIPLKIVYVSSYSDTSDVIIGKPEYNSLADLKGKKIGINGINTFSHLFVLSAAEKAGLREEEMRIAIVPIEETIIALEQGKIEAGHIWAPVKTQALAKGYKILAKAGDRPGLFTDVLAVTPKLIEERPQDVQAIVNALLEARNFIYTNREEAITIMAVSEGTTFEEMNEGINGIHQPDQMENIQAMQKSSETTSLYGAGAIISDFYLKRGQLSMHHDLKEIIEPRFVNNARRK